MRRDVVAVVLGMLMLSGTASAQVDVGHIGIFADLDAGSCQIQDVDGVVTVYVLHVGATEANTSQFRVAQDPGVNMTFLSGTVNPALLALGNIETGITITYVGCKTSFPLLLATLQYSGTGTTTVCSGLRVVADPALPSGEIEVIDCSSGIHYIESISGWVNSTGDCACEQTRTIVDTDPPGLIVRVDADLHTSPVYLWDPPGTVRRIGAVSPQGPYVFESWSDGGAMTHDFIIPNVDTTVTANFVSPPRLTINTVPPGLLVTIDGSAYFAPRELIDLPGTAYEIGVVTPQGSPDMQYTFLSWSDGGAVTHTFVMPETDTTVTATFELPPPFTIDTDPTALAVNVDLVWYTAPKVFHWPVGTSHDINTVSPQGPASDQYDFINWSDGGAKAHSVVAPGVDTTITATFNLAPVFTISTDPQGLDLTTDGVTAPAPHVRHWSGGSKHLVSAPSPQRTDTTYAFNSWSDGGAAAHEVTAPGSEDSLKAFYDVADGPEYADALIGIYRTPAASHCNFTDDTVGLVTLEIVHTGVMAANTSQFRIQESPGITMTFNRAILRTGLALGDVHTGITITYGMCKPPFFFPLHLMTLEYSAEGTSQPCSYIEVVGDPASGSGQIEVVDCTSSIFSGTGGKLVVNGDASCMCISPVETKSTTWGQVKGLYRK